MCRNLYEIKRGYLKFREEKQFKTVFHKIQWLIEMRLRGFIIKKISD